MRKARIALVTITVFCLINGLMCEGRSQFSSYYLKGQGFNDEQFAEWVKGQSNTGSLVQLNLAANSLTARSIKALVASDLENIHTLLLTDNPLGDDGAKALASSAKFSATAILFLANTQITSQGAGYLFGQDSCIRFVEQLDLSKNDLGDTGVTIVANSHGVKKMTELYLDHVGMTDAGAMALAKSPNLGNVHYLSMSGNAVTEAGVLALKKSKSFSDTVGFFFGEALE